MLILSSSGTAAVCNLGFMAELDTSGHCLLPGRLQVTDSKSIQVSPPPSVLCPVLRSIFVLQETIEVLIAEQALINEVTDQCSVKCKPLLLFNPTLPQRYH